MWETSKVQGACGDWRWGFGLGFCNEFWLTRRVRAAKEYLTASLCHKTASISLIVPPDSDEDTEAVEQESLFSAFAPIRVSTPRTAELFPKGFEATINVEVREGTSRIRRVVVEPEEGALRKMVEEGKRRKEDGVEAGGEMEL